MPYSAVGSITDGKLKGLVQKSYVREKHTNRVGRDLRSCLKLVHLVKINNEIMFIQISTSQSAVIPILSMSFFLSLQRFLSIIILRCLKSKGRQIIFVIGVETVEYALSAKY